MASPSAESASAQAPRKLSAERTARIKYVYPLIYFGSLIPFAVSYLRNVGDASPMPGLMLLAVMLLFGFFAMKYFLWDLADEVYDHGDTLLIRRRGVEEIVPLSNVQDATFANLRPPRLTLHLIKAGRFGNKISFSPVAKRLRNPFAKNPIMLDLAVRAWRARSGHDGTDA